MRERIFNAKIPSLAFKNIFFPLYRNVSTLRPLVIYYHLVSDQVVPHVSKLYSFRTLSQFERDMDVLLQFFKPLSLQEFLCRRKTGQHANGREFLVTFDDGLRECFEIIVPILRRKGIPGTFFLCSSFLDNADLGYDAKKSLLVTMLDEGRWTTAEKAAASVCLTNIGLSDGSLRELILSVDYRRRTVLDDIAGLVDLCFSDYLRDSAPYLDSAQVTRMIGEGHAIGAHSIDHPRYEHLPLAEQLRQTRESVDCVRQRFSLNYGAFAFPNSDANVPKVFFREAINAGGGSVDLCFGNQGFMEECEEVKEVNFQRMTMEKTALPAEVLVGQQYARRLGKRALGRHVIVRS
jgi:peptidoglycan/xylan/chitin deacetylase (PgdA/CDA1 family)